MKIKPYTPDFTTAFEHFCIHPGGKAVIEEVGKQLKLSPEQCLPMLVPFERYGNTSSSSTWWVFSLSPLCDCCKEIECISGWASRALQARKETEPVASPGTLSKKYTIYF